MSSMRDKLNAIRAEIQAAERSPLAFLNPSKIIALVWLVWGLLEAIVNHLERSSPDGKPEGTDRRL
jgi:hypothetical protein